MSIINNGHYHSRSNTVSAGRPHGYLDHAIRQELGRLELCAKAAAQASNVDTCEAIADIEKQRTALALQLKDEERRLDRVEDLLLDGEFDRDAFARKQGKIRLRLAGLREELQKLPNPEALAAHQEQLAELRKSLVLLYDMANRAEKRMIIENVWPNRTVSRNEPAFKPYSWVRGGQNGLFLLGGTQERDRGRSGHDIAPDDMSLIQPLLELFEVIFCKIEPSSFE